MNPEDWTIKPPKSLPPPSAKVAEWLKQLQGAEFTVEAEFTKVEFIAPIFVFQHVEGAL